MIEFLMAGGGSDELAKRLQHISELTEALMNMQHENVAARQLADRISREIAAAREHLKQLPPAKKS